MFVEKSRFKRFEKGQDIFEAGAAADAFYLVVEGWIKLYRITRDGEEAIINIFAPGETFAEAAVFGPARRYPVNAQAVEKTAVLEIPRNVFVEKIKQDSEFALHILAAIAARQHYLVQQIEQVTVKSAPQRIGFFLLKLCPPGQTGTVEIDLPYDKSLVSRRLNIQPETFSRALAKLKPCGVSMKGRCITIKDINRLAEFCDVEDRDRPC